MVMNIEEVRTYCLSKLGVTECLPFDEDTLVFKVGGKMFALLALDESPSSINLKCEPNLATELRESHTAIRPGYHMNKKHWNTITLDESLSDMLVCQLIDHSYALVVEGLPARLKKELSYPPPK